MGARSEPESELELESKLEDLEPRSGFMVSSAATEMRFLRTQVTSAMALSTFELPNRTRVWIHHPRVMMTRNRSSLPPSGRLPQSYCSMSSSHANSQLSVSCHTGWITDHHPIHLLSKSSMEWMSGRLPGECSGQPCLYDKSSSTVCECFVSLHLPCHRVSKGNGLIGKVYLQVEPTRVLQEL